MSPLIAMFRRPSPAEFIRAMAVAWKALIGCIAALVLAPCGCPEALAVALVLVLFFFPYRLFDRFSSRSRQGNEKWESLEGR